MSNAMTRNLSDIKNATKPVFKMGQVQFLREKFIRFMDIKLEAWKAYCTENDIEILEEVKVEIAKFRTALEKEAVVTDKMFNVRLAFGDNETLETKADRWFDEYL